MRTIYMHVFLRHAALCLRLKSLPMWTKAGFNTQFAHFLFILTRFDRSSYVKPKLWNSRIMHPQAGPSNILSTRSLTLSFPPMALTERLTHPGSWRLEAYPQTPFSHPQTCSSLRDSPIRRSKSRSWNVRDAWSPSWRSHSVRMARPLLPRLDLHHWDADVFRAFEEAR